MRSWRLLIMFAILWRGVHSYGSQYLRPLLSRQYSKCLLQLPTQSKRPSSKLYVKKQVDEYKAQRDSYKEDSRVYRRTVFNEERISRHHTKLSPLYFDNPFKDWKKFRRSDRMFTNVLTMFNSGVIRGLGLEIGSVFGVALVVFLTNWAISAGVFIPFGIEPSTLFRLPVLPFTLSSPALSLLLVFRTNSVQARWNTGKSSWEIISSSAQSLARQGIIYLNEDEKVPYAKSVLALTYCIVGAFRTDDEGKIALRDRLEVLLGEEEADLIANAAKPHAVALIKVANLVRSTAAKGIDGSTKARFDLHLDELNKQTTKCLMMKKSPIPLVYTRHTSRFLAIWVLLLPLALVGELQGNASWLVIPVSSLVATFFFGIEELGVQLEEPFSVMPLEDTMRCIEENIWEMVEAEAAISALESI